MRLLNRRTPNQQTEITGHLIGIENKLVEYLRVFLSNPSIQLIKRVFAVYGPPGMGKTWFLKYCSQKKFTPQDYSVIFIDLEERKNKSPDAFANICRAKVAHLVDPTLPILCLIDNVPGIFDDEQMEVFERSFWSSFIHQKVFIIWAQTSPNNVGWREINPTPHNLPGFGKNELSLFLSGSACSASSDAEKILFSTDEHIPGLTTWICKAKKNRPLDSQVLQDYLINWSQRIGENLSIDHIEIAARLACKNTVTNDATKIYLNSYPNASDNISNYRGKLKRLRWIKEDYTWYKPIRQVLRAWLFLCSRSDYSSLCQEPEVRNGN